MSSENRKIYRSDICIDGKRINAMREIAKATFGESFLFIEVDTSERVFVVRVDDCIDVNKLNQFTDKYRLCKVKIYKEIDPPVAKGEKRR